MRKVNETQREERRTTILEAAARCFRRSGFRGASISDICRESGIGVGNLYHYFQNKEAMVEAIAARDSVQTEKTLDDLDKAADVLAFLAGHPDIADPTGYVIDDALTAEIIAESARNPRMAAIRRQADLAIRQRLAEVLRNAQAQGRVNASLDPDGAAWMLLLFGEALGLRRITDTPAEAERGLQMIMAQIRQMLAPEPVGEPDA